MFSLLGGLWQFLFKKDDYFVLIVGLDNAGKTTMLDKFKSIDNPAYQGMPPDKITPTVGLNVGRLTRGRTRLTFWDLGGQHELHSIWPEYYKETHALIYVVDASDPARLQDSQQVFESVVASPNMESVPVLVLANKSDVAGALDIPQIKTVFNASAGKVGKRDCKVSRVSAKTGENLVDSVVWLIDAIQRNVERRPPAQEEL